LRERLLYLAIGAGFGASSYGPVGIDVFAFLAAIAITLRYRQRPPWWLLALTASVAIGLLWTANVPATLTAAARIYTVGTVLLWIHTRRPAPAGSWVVAPNSLIALGALGILALQLFALLPGILEGRQAGWTRYETILGTTGFMLLILTPQRAGWATAGGWIVGVLLLAASGARAPLVALGVWVATALSRRRVGMMALVLVAFSTALWSTGNLSRLLPGQALQAARVRAATVDPAAAEGPGVCAIARAEYGPDYQCAAGEISWLGDGAHAYLSANPWPRPHNIYAIAVHELGVFTAVPVLVLVWAVATRRVAWQLVVSLLVLGAFDDTALSQPEGHYVVAALLLVAAQTVKDARDRAGERERPQ